MSIRVATYNVMNLFRRPRAMNLQDWDAGRPILEDVAELNDLLSRDRYTPAIRDQIRAILERNHLNSRKRSKWNFVVNQVRKKLYSVSRATRRINVRAAGRSSWIGWVELPGDTLDNAAINNTARVIAEVNADVLCLVEVDDRITLQRFHDDLLVGRGFLPSPERRYGHSMLIDGNDDRGIDVAMLSRFAIQSVWPHIDDDYAAGNRRYKIFSRDCPEFAVILPNGEPLWVLVNHLKSKGYGTPRSSNAKRRRQAERINEILRTEYDLRYDYVVVAGDLNDTPDSAPLQPLIRTRYLYDVLDSLPAGADRWTYRTGAQQIDYLLVSRPLRDALTDVAIERRGIYSQSDFGGMYPSFDAVKGLTSQASDHAAIRADFDIGG